MNQIIFLSVTILVLFLSAAEGAHPFFRLQKIDKSAVLKPNPLQWGPKGHAAVATIAQALINSNVTSALQTLLPDSNGQMPPIASWADDMRSNPAYDWSKPLHFINTPDWACTYERSRDCIDPTYGANYCVDMAIQNYSARVLENSLGYAQQNEAIKFLVHFIGDIHQPLHCGFTSDLGGNDIRGTYEGDEWNLHAIWDDALISTAIDNFFNGDTDQWYQNLTSMAQAVSPSTLKQWVSCGSYDDPFGACSDEWGMESVQLACKYSYVAADGTTKLTSGFDLEDPYFNRNYPIVEMQLLKGGIRLANTLNNMFPVAKSNKPARFVHV